MAVPSHSSRRTSRRKRGDVLAGFHPAVRAWFTGKFGKPTRVQERGWEAIRTGGHTLIAAPTGSGKTLSAFLNALDELIREGEAAGGELPDETRVVYVSPLKALSADIHQNLAEPRREIRRVAQEMGIEAPRITAGVRSGDTPSRERQSMLATPPHILVTTPESLYLLLTGERSREMLRTVRTVIVDEIHAVVESRRGSHLALTLERLEHVVNGPLQRVGLSATQKPIEEVAQFLVGASGETQIIDEGHVRELDLGIEVPNSPVEAVLSGEVREEIYDRVTALIHEHNTTLVFVNTRREAERTVHRLAERLGTDAVMAHHGSLSKESRLEAERRLREGSLKALVATASLELGIDIGHVDLVCQIGATHRIATLLQRVGRSGHTVHGTPKGRLFPMTRDELIEAAALKWSVMRGELDRIEIPDAPLDILAQQITAEVACEEWDEDALFDLFRRAHPYRHLERVVFDEVVRMISQGFTTSNGRRGARIHYDAVNRRLKGRRGSRLAAITSGGAIPDNADYRVVLEPEDTFVGTVNEDFAVESMPGDVFQLGSTAWRILRVEAGAVRVEDASGEPPSIPFWFGEAPARSPELSAAVSELRREVADREPSEARAWLENEVGLSGPAAFQIVEYLAETKRMLGTVPTTETLILERFFDESGGMQLILHAPFGSRVNRAWGLALRKRFCRQFNFELQAAATEEGVLLSLGPQHSFPLEDVFRYLNPESVEDLLVQALFDAPMFQTHWRWNASLSLALLRWRSGRKVAPQIQRMEAEDLLVGVFPDAAACLENIAGDREIPDHPLVRQTIHDCLTEVMDLPRLKSVLQQIHDGTLTLVARDTPEPSPIAHEILTARPYAFLDDAPLEERRANAVRTRRALEPSSAGALGRLDEEAIRRVRDESRPVVENADELHDALLSFGFLPETEEWRAFFEILNRERRAAEWNGLWIAAEKIPEARLVWEDFESDVEPPRGVSVQDDRERALREIIRGRMAILGPVTAAQLSERALLSRSDIDFAFLLLEGEGSILRGRFTPGAVEEEWCDRRLLARIHRYTLDRLRSEIQPVSSAEFMRFLLRWQRVEPEYQVTGPEGVMAIIEQLEGLELPGVSWETDVLPARCTDYSPDDLDMLCASGRVMWGRLSAPAGDGLKSTGPIRSSPIALWKRENAEFWLRNVPAQAEIDLSTYARKVYEALDTRGASFFQELIGSTNLLPTQIEQGLGELVAYGLVTSDSFSGLRALLTPVDQRNVPSRKKRHGKTAPYGVHSAGRWSLLKNESRGSRVESDVEAWARILLRRYGVVFRRLVAREAFAPPWRDLLRVLWRLEARGEIRGGRFINGFTGEQFALPEALGSLRKIRKEEPDGSLIVLSAADPLNLTGIVATGERITAISNSRIGLRDGIPVLALEAGRARSLQNDDPVPHDIQKALKRRPVSDKLRILVR